MWIGSLQSDGYGQIELPRSEGRRQHKMAHRLVYELTSGAPGENLHHRPTCPKRCVNPAHLTPMTIAEHASEHGRRTHCVHGHSLDDAYIRGDGRGRVCKTCCLERMKGWWWRQPEEKRKALTAKSSERRRQKKAAARAAAGAQMLLNAVDAHL